ncbi:MAG TPA: DUF6691 family protein, partial [Usitatibacter sp.]
MRTRKALATIARGDARVHGGGVSHRFRRAPRHLVTRAHALGTVASLATGMIFAAGLIVSGMVNPAKVQGFLDLFGRWDPSLALVMAAAVGVG